MFFEVDRIREVQASSFAWSNPDQAAQRHAVVLEEGCCGLRIGRVEQIQNVLAQGNVLEACCSGIRNCNY